MICGVFKWAWSIKAKRNKTKQDKRLHGALPGDSWGSVQVPAAGCVDAQSDQTTLGAVAATDSDLWMITSGDESFPLLLNEKESNFLPFKHLEVWTY